MKFINIGKGVRAAFKNAVVWGIGFGAAALGVFAILGITGTIAPNVGFLDAVGMSVRIGIMGGIASFAFAGAIRVLYRKRNIYDIDWKRFALAGAIVTGLFVPAFMQSMSLLSGGGLVPLRDIGTDIIYSALFGGLVAGASLRIAQRARRAATESPLSYSEDVDNAELLESGGRAGIPMKQRSRTSVER